MSGFKIALVVEPVEFKKSGRILDIREDSKNSPDQNSPEISIEFRKPWLKVNILGNKKHT
jgi:hypothetical protein